MRSSVADQMIKDLSSESESYHTIEDINKI
jgi:hypothetical protein